MPYVSPEGIRTPAGSDNYALSNDLRLMMESARTIVPVANEAGRNLVKTALDGAGRTPSLDAPVFVWRADTKAIEGHWGDGWKPVDGAATLRVLIPESAGYTVDEWTGMTPAGSPVSTQTNDPYGIFSIDVPGRRVVVGAPGLYMVTSRVGTKALTGTPNTSQRILANLGVEAEGRMPADLGTTSLSTQVRLSAGDGIAVQTFRYSASANVTLAGHLHVTRLSA